MVRGQGSQCLHIVQPFAVQEKAKQINENLMYVSQAALYLSLSNFSYHYVKPPRETRNPAFTQAFRTNHAQKFHEIYIYSKFTQSR